MLQIHCRHLTILAVVGENLVMNILELRLAVYRRIGRNCTVNPYLRNMNVSSE
jgi:hypothetical protein